MIRTLMLLTALCAFTLGSMACSEEPATENETDAATLPSDSGIDAGMADVGAPDALMEVDMEAGDANPVGTFDESEPVELEPDVITETAVNSVFSAESHGIVAQTENAIVLIDSDGIMPLVDTAEGDELRGGAVVGDDFIIATSNGLYSLFEGELRPSPADELLDEVYAFHTDPNDTVWLLTAGGLFVWANGQLFGVSSPEVPGDLSSAMATIAPWQQGHGLWFVTDSGLTGLTFEDNMADAWTVELEEDVESIAGNEDGLWALTETELKMMSPDGLWLRYERPEIGTAISAHAKSSSLWLHQEGSLHRIIGDTITAVEPSPEFTGVHAEASGSTLVFGSNGIARVRLGRFVTVTGLSEGAALNAAATVTISATEQDDVTEVEVSIDGEVIESADSIPLSIELDPMNITVGNHTLSVSIRYTDDQTITSDVSFSGPPGWSQHIEPLFVAQCAMCHGNRPDARSLETPMSWIDDFDLIVFDVETGRMPLGLDPLTPAEIEMVRGWGAGGFQE